ncbi:hypothetical protein [Oceanibaculum pacificum]|uniref:AAA+ family ATPase n=1 Tax=Oceanibaculum pacificum TaxID=580166 RepID=A0A154VQL5_9PROT|nr:hypothetical protein [Oceanibaculum pacificum]KZD03529.1 hypothetical protein AUP43_12760 [Oceanibaculum pacificum]
MFRLLLASALLLVAAGLPARAESPVAPLDAPVESLREGAITIMEALRGIVEEMQRYGVPYLDDKGNIVIPRSEEPPRKRAPAPESNPETLTL